MSSIVPLGFSGWHRNCICNSPTDRVATWENDMTKRQGTADAAAAKQSTKRGQQITRQKTRTRQEVRRETTHRQGHPK